MRSTHRANQEILSIKKAAEDLARSRKERPSTLHLLVAVSEGSCAAAQLLTERGITAQVLLRYPAVDTLEDAIPKVLELTVSTAQRAGVERVTASHLLVALLSDRGMASREALESLDRRIDIPRLRTAAMHQAQEIIGKRRIVGSEPEQPTQRTRAPAEAPRRVAQGVPVSASPTPTRAPQGRSIPTFARNLPKEETSSAINVRSHSTPPPPPPLQPAAAQPAPGQHRRGPHTPSRGATGGHATAQESAAVARFQLDARKYPTLSQLGRNLSLAAARGELDPVVGREAEVQSALDVLAKRQGNNPVLVGDAGVGKTSVVRGMAQHIATGKDVASLDDRIVIEIAVGELVAGTAVRGALAQRFQAIRNEVAASNGRVVLFLDELHQLFSGDAADEIAGDFKLALSRGELPCIGATTREEYAKHIERDGALARRFTLVEVDEPSREDAYLVLEALAPKLSLHHHVKYQSEALALAVSWSIRYIAGRSLPDKAIAIVDLAGARARRRGGAEVTPEQVAEIVSEMTEVPLERLMETDGDRMLRMERLLGDRVVGHEASLQRIARILRRNAAGFGARRPLGTFLLLGPTGVGKTETAKAVAEVLFHSEHAMTRIDMAEYSESHAVARLIGSPPGYVGHDAGGQLTETVRKRPYQVVLLDEIEKAHPEVLLAFLGVFDEGRLTDGRGRTVDFTNTVLLMTSNLGSSEAAQGPRRKVGFGNASNGESKDRDKDQADREKLIVSVARAALAPELYNRIDEVLVFAPLERDDVRRIAARTLHKLAERLFNERGIRLDWDDAALDGLLDEGGFDASLGARPLRRAIARLIEAPMAELILDGSLQRGSTARLERLAQGLRISPLPL